MDDSEQDDLQSGIKVSIEDPDFFIHAFTYVARKRKEREKLEPNNFKRVSSEEFEEVSRRIDSFDLQESCSVRNILRTRRLATLLIDEKGMLNKPALTRLIKEVSEHLYFLGPNRHYDSKRQEQILSVLKLLDERKDLVSALQSISKPYMSKFCDDVIRATLQLPANIPLTVAHARRAVLAAWMCYLRQALGSCFATAPAIIVHDEQPLQFLLDINQLFATGQLKRTIGGVEYSVPMSNTWGGTLANKPFYLNTSPDVAATALCQQPGLINALEAAGVIDPEGTKKEKIQKLKALVKELFKTIGSMSDTIITNPGEILRWILLRHFSLTEEDIKEYENRSQTVFQGTLMMQAVQSVKSGGKAKQCANFQLAFNEAKSAFKSLTDNALLRVWEYSIASFAETKAEFSKWNLYSSLGLRHDDPGGIGQCIFGILQKKVDEFNRKTEEYQSEYEMVFAQVKMLESRTNSATSEDQLRRMRADLQSKVNELHMVQEMRDRANITAKRFANLFDELIDYYLKLFPKFFQEVYDAEIVDVNLGPYDDSPAGFRLLYKHGRTNTSQWTYIYDHNQFIQSLANFFIAAEREMANDNSFKGIQNDLTDITTSIVSHVRTNDFLETAFHRMAIAHNMPAIKDPLNHLDKIEKKPWVYTSGGNLKTLVNTYFRREHPPTEVSRWVESPKELLVFLVDTIKILPHKLMESFAESPNSSMLIHSPTHAFLLKPGYPVFKESWEKDDYTYIWMRDQLITPMERAIEGMMLNNDSMQFLVSRLANKVPLNFQPRFKDVFGAIKGSMPPGVFRDYLVDNIQKDRGLQYGKQPVLSSNMIDSLLYSQLPVFPLYKLKENVQVVLSQLPNISERDIEAALQIIERLTGRIPQQNVIGSQGLQNICKALICLVLNDTSFPIDYHKQVKKVCEKERFAIPGAIHFADTNWTKDEFAFTVNPGTGKFELWRMDVLGLEGEPMSSWDPWLDGSRKKPDWGIYTKPFEYRF